MRGRTLTAADFLSLSDALWVGHGALPDCQAPERGTSEKSARSCLFVDQA